MNRGSRFSVLLFRLLCLTMLIGGCKCSEDAETTTDKLTGTTDVEQMNKIKKELKGINQMRRDQAEKLKRDSTE